VHRAKKPGGMSSASAKSVVSVRATRPASANQADTAPWNPGASAGHTFSA